MSVHDDFWLDQITHPNDAQGDPLYGPVTPGHPHWQRFTTWRDLGPHGEYLRSEQIKWVWIHPNNGKIWHLEGPGRGREGVVLARELDGVMHAPFDIKYFEGAYMIGADPQRVDYPKRVVHFGVWIQPNGNAERPSPGGPFAHHMITDAWWQSWSREVPGYLGCWTRTHGWRWLKLLLGEAPKHDLKISPVANGNNTTMVSITAHAPQPFYAKRAITKVWAASQNDVIAHGVSTGVISIPNRGTWRAHPKYLIQGKGTATVQDGPEGKQIELPEIYTTDGAYIMVDTDPARQTIVTEKDPIDSQLYKYMRNSQLLDLLFHDELASKLPAQRRIPGGVGFNNPIPPRTVAHLKVTHDNPNATITVIMPQQYEMAWS